MTDYAFPPAPAPSIPTIGGQAFPVRRIFCVGQNYAAHAREMGSNPDRVRPFFFSKPADSLVANNATIPYPPRTENLHHEVELVVAIGIPGSAIPVESAPDHIWGYAAGVDLTRRDMQNAAKDKRQPWDMAKGFDCSALVGDVAPIESIGHISSAEIALRVNGTTRQSANIDEMIWTPAEILVELSTYVSLKPGDIVFTGTPAGVGPIQKGDVIEAEIKRLPILSIHVSKQNPISGANAERT